MKYFIYIFVLFFSVTANSQTYEFKHLETDKTSFFVITNLNNELESIYNYEIGGNFFDVSFNNSFGVESLANLNAEKAIDRVYEVAMNIFLNGIDTNPYLYFSTASKNIGQIKISDSDYFQFNYGAGWWGSKTSIMSPGDVITFRSSVAHISAVPEPEYIYIFILCLFMLIWISRKSTSLNATHNTIEKFT